jgi:hypothetical protein
MNIQISRINSNNNYYNLREEKSVVRSSPLAMIASFRIKCVNRIDFPGRNIGR